MQLEERIADNVAIVKVIGDITLNKGRHVILKDKINSLVQQGHKNIVVDLSDVSYVDSSGLGELVQAYVTTRKGGGTMKLMNLTKRLNDLLVVTKLLTVFETFDSKEKAVSSFEAGHA